MNANAQAPILGDLGPVQEEEQTLRKPLEHQFQRMDKTLEDPNLTPDERYKIVSKLIGWLE